MNVLGSPRVDGDDDEDDVDDLENKFNYAEGMERVEANGKGKTLIFLHLLDMNLNNRFPFSLTSNK